VRVLEATEVFSVEGSEFARKKNIFLFAYYHVEDSVKKTVTGQRWPDSLSNSALEK
jgi:hypothetical protein